MTESRPDNEAIFHAARDTPDPDRRREYVREACGGDEARIAHIEALLAAAAAPDSLLDRLVRSDPVATIDQPTKVRPGTVIGPYKLLQQIGEGGMGVVWMAEQTQPVQRKVALKVIKPGMDSHQVIARFEAERQALAMMDHVNIARVIDGGTTESGQPYFVMELVHGVPITKYCDDNHLTPRERLELFVPVCQAIQHAHQKGIIHRDVKPSNVIVTLYDGKPVPKVIDFGVAKATEQKLTERTLFTQYGTMVGTLEYMSPEQAEMSARGVDTRSDIYSLGVLLYELLTGSTPLSRKRLKEAALGEILRMIKEEEPPKPSTRLSDSGEALASISANRHTEPAKLTKLIRGELDWIVMKTLEKDRSRRYETANGFAADVQRYLNDETVYACPPSAGYRLRKFARRNTVALTMASLVLFFLAVLGIAVGWSIRDRQAREREIAQELSGRLALTEHGLRQSLDGADKSRAELHAALTKQGGVRELLNQPARWEMLLKSTKAELAQARWLVAAAEGGLDSTLTQAVDRLEHQHSVDDAIYALALRLEKTRLDKSTIRESDFDVRTANEEYSKMYAEFGDLTLDPGSVASRLAASPIREHLVAGLDDWAMNAFKLQQTDLVVRLLAVSRQVMPNAVWANRLRQLTVWSDQAALAKLVAEAPVDELSPAILDFIGLLLSKDAGLRVAWLRRAQAQHPTDFWLSFQLAWVLSDPAEVIGYFRIALAIRPTSSVVYLNVGYNLRKLRKFPEAIAAYRKAIELDPKFAPAYFNLGNILRAQGNWPEAIKAYRNATEADPRYVPPYVAMGSSLFVQNKWLEAAAWHRKAIEIDPKYSLAYNGLGSALYHQKKIPEAIDAFQKAVEYDPNSVDAYANLGNALREHQQPDRAIEACRKAIKLDPKQPLAYHTLGMAFAQQQKWAEAAQALRAASEIDPKFARAYLNLGIILGVQQKYSESVEAYREGIRLDPGLASGPDNSQRHSAACAAVLAAAGRGVGADKPGVADPARLRGQAMDWLRADLIEKGTFLSDHPATAKAIRGALQNWLDNPDLSGVRDEKGLAALPREEGDRWTKLWGEVRDLLRRTNQ